MRKIKTPTTPLKSPRSRSFLGLAALALVLVGASYGGYYLHSHNQKAKIQANPHDPGHTINYGPPTAADKQQVDANKDKIVQQEQEQKSNQGSSVTSVSPVITHVGQAGNQIEVDAFVGGVVEDGGTCTLTAKNGALTITKQATGAQNATTTLCPHFFIDRSEFTTSGSWSFTVNYTSSGAQGTSQTTTYDVQ